jgi:8-oxo-dGTP diphosphatase
MTNIQKAGGVILKDRHFLVTRSLGKDIFVAPGGKLEEGESAATALKRELKEELEIDVNTATLKQFGTFHAEAAGQAGVMLEMQVFLVSDYTGELLPSNEIEEMKWINTQTTDVKIGSIFEHEVMPLLKRKGLID